jgi:hypothetical protein
VSQPRLRPERKLLRGVDSRRRSDKDWPRNSRLIKTLLLCFSPRVGGSAKERCQDQGRERRGEQRHPAGICVTSRGRQRRLQQRSRQSHRGWFVAALVLCHSGLLSLLEKSRGTHKLVELVLQNVEEYLGKKVAFVPYTKHVKIP